MARVIICDDFYEVVACLKKNLRDTVRKNIRVITDILSLTEVSDEHTFLIYNLDILHILDDYPALSIKHYAPGISEELIFTRDSLAEQIQKLAEKSYENPEIEHLQKYRRMQLEIDMGM